MGTTSGHRFVVGRWPESPFGAFADVMHEGPDGRRRLLAPTAAIGAFVATTYGFDEVEVVPVVAERAMDRLVVDAGDLHLEIVLGRRTALGWLLRAVPGPVAASTAWCTAISPIARTVLRGVRTRGSAGAGRTEWYGAADQHAVLAVRASEAGQDLGGLAAVWPPVRFGFSSTPKRPSIVAVTTTIDGDDLPAL